MNRARGVSFVAAVALAVTAAPALAVPPVITSVSHENRHPLLTFSAPRGNWLTVEFASKPDQATDGTFLRENVAYTGLPTNAEAAAGRWLSNRQLDPGHYYVHMQATRASECVSYNDAFETIVDPACADGWSSIVELTVPMPKIKYTVKHERAYKSAFLTLTASPYGAKLPYKVCWKPPKAKKDKCKSGELSGYGWDSPARHLISISTKGLSPRTKFTWYTRGAKPKKLVSKTFKVR
jgi:hypothetical protein